MHIQLVAKLHGVMNPVELVVYGAYATRREEPPYRIYEMHSELEREEKIRSVLRHTLSSGHLSVLEQAVYTYNLVDIPRTATLYLSQSRYISHIQQSMRLVKSERYILSSKIEGNREIKSLLEETFNIYNDMVDDGVPIEDARYILPLAVATNTQITLNMRELTNLVLSARHRYIPETVRNLVSKMIEALDKEDLEMLNNYGENYNTSRYIPMNILFREEDGNLYILNPDTNLDDTAEKLLKNALKYHREEYIHLLRHYRVSGYIRASLVALHQLLRHRTIYIYPESIYKAVRNGLYIVPKTVEEHGYRDRYVYIVEKLIYTVDKLSREGYRISDLIDLTPHALKLNVYIETDGWHILTTYPQRRCLKAQWEIREIFTRMTRYIDSRFRIYTLPPCLREGTCPEKHPCIYADKLLEKGRKLSKKILDGDIEKYIYTGET